MEVSVGQQAPDFELADEEQKLHKLSNYLGRKVLLVFYPADWSPICTDELSFLSADIETYNAHGVAILGVSVDNTYSHKAFKQDRDYKMSLLSDFWPHGRVAKLYGVFDEQRGVAKRGTFFIDENGIVRDAFVHDVSTARNKEEFLQLLSKAA